MHKVLVIEDELDIAKLVQLHLQDLPCEVNLAFDGIVGLAEAEAKPYDLIILDLKLPGLEGLEVCKRLRARGRYTPILMLTSRDSTQDVVRGLNAGADDYLTKPFALEELLARVSALTRRQFGPATGILRYQDLEMDRLRRVVKRGGRTVDLAPREFRLLEFFLLNPERVVTRTALLEKVWDMSFDPQTNVVDAHISNLRRKLEEGERPRLIQTVRGAGYSLRTTDAD